MREQKTQRKKRCSELTVLHDSHLGHVPCGNVCIERRSRTKCCRSTYVHAVLVDPTEKVKSEMAKEEERRGSNEVRIRGGEEKERWSELTGSHINHLGHVPCGKVCIERRSRIKCCGSTYVHAVLVDPTEKVKSEM